MQQVFVLWHVHDLGEVEDAKLVGIFSSEDDALSAQRRAERRPGFVDSPEGFSISSYKLGVDNWPDGFVTVAPDGERAGNDKRAA